MSRQAHPRRVSQLAAITDPDTGREAATLARMRAAGFPVPEAVVNPRAWTPWPVGQTIVDDLS